MIQAFGLTSNPRKELPPAVDDVSFEARAGRVTALLGAPGAGKTTALRLMLELQQGRGITYFRGRPLHRIAHPAREVGVMLGDVPGHPARTVRGHLRMLCAAAGVPARRADEVLEAVGLVSLREERLGTLSRGMDRRLGLACALLADPHALVLDDPADGLSPRETRWLHSTLRAHADRGGTVLLTTADPKAAARAADRVVTLDQGRLVADQDVADFARTRLRPRVAIRSPHAARLAALLAKEARTAQRSVEVVREGGNRLFVYGSTCADIGETAFRHGIVVHQLADEIGDMGPGAEAAPPGVPHTPQEPAPAEGSRAVDARQATHTLRSLAGTSEKTADGNRAARVPQASAEARKPPFTAASRPTAGGPHPRHGEPQFRGGELQPCHGEPQLRAGGPQARNGEPQFRGGELQPRYGDPRLSGGGPQPRNGERNSRRGGPQSLTAEQLRRVDGSEPSADAQALADVQASDAPGASVARPQQKAAARALGPAQARGGDSLPSLPPPISVRPARSPLRPLRYELRRAVGISTGFLTGAAVLVASAFTAVLLARIGHTPQSRLLVAWPRELPLPPAALGAGLLGALSFGDEFRHPALAADRGTVPRRLGLLAAKLLVSAATALMLAVLTVGCDAEMLYLFYGRELAQVPADWLSLSAGWVGLVVGCAWAGVLAAGLFRSTTAGLAAVVAVPLLVVPVVHKVWEGPSVRTAAGLPMRLRELFLVQWPFGGERYLAAALRVVAQPVGSAMTFSLATLLCAYLLTTLRSRVR
ncbi:ATP-binding cassette domain-containing protein [Streptomyces sp. S.PNR 29]|uniref:ATP-binding cassette domain-containing protein n=1 Tax=Streptomyces sp. S.PNR 29 TaxID=2973805 RepID=UPI0025B0C545|nr:ATP-binding cassette domain-containing protein [Streptomyces sp. S.PNR 29]MDN0197528.1 ATP-binding cassette domain-containing protein [Streptomyces sp. S.PNR 29]